MNDEDWYAEGKKRIAIIDTLRGIALLGIFFVNMPAFFSPWLYLNPSEYWKDGLDQALSVFVDLFFQGSFYPLFAFLFGYGAVLMSESLQGKGLSFPLYFSRRLLILLVFGMLHAFLIWHGDILMTYAVCGLVFLLFYKRKPGTMLAIGLVTYGMINGMLVLSSLSLNQGEALGILYDPEAVRISIEAYQNGPYSELFNRRFTEWASVNGPFGMGLQLLSIVPMMLAGGALAKQKWLENAGDKKGMVAALAVCSLIFGLFLKLAPYLPSFKEYPYTALLVQDQFGGPLLTLFYIAAIVLLGRLKTFRKTLTAVSYAGRLSLSNYLFQSLLSTSLFYSYGLGLYGQLSYKSGFCLVIFIYAGQLIFSKWWLERFRYGPAEYIWRWGTYGEKPVFRKGGRKR